MFQVYSVTHIEVTHIEVTHIEAYLPTLGFRHIQDPSITDSSNVNQQLLLKSGSSFKTLLRSIWNIFSFLIQK